MKLSKIQKEILGHRLDAGVTADCLCDTDEAISRADADASVKNVKVMVADGAIPTEELSQLEREVLADLIDGSTFFANSEDEVACGNMSHQKLSAWIKAAEQLEDAVSDCIGRACVCPKY